MGRARFIFPPPADARHRPVHRHGSHDEWRHDCDAGSGIAGLYELWQTVERRGVQNIAIVGDAFAKPMLAALEENAELMTYRAL